ncbi:MAG: NADH-quinone oxidoreductase subunit H [Nitrosospira sp.]
MSELARNWSNVILILIVVFSFAALLSWIERRLLGVWQDRYGPNRVGPFGVLQAVADAIKLMTKEDWIPPFADRALFVLAPMIIAVTTLLAFASCRLRPVLAWSI